MSSNDSCTSPTAQLYSSQSVSPFATPGIACHIEDVNESPKQRSATSASGNMSSVTLKALLAWAAVLVGCRGERRPARAPLASGAAQLRIVVRDRSLGSEEIERLVMDPIEAALHEVPHIAHVRSTSSAGVGVVSLELQADSYESALRADVAGRLRQLGLPADALLEVDPPLRLDGVVARYTVTSEHVIPAIARGWHDETARPHLLRVPGVAGIATCGDDRDRWQVQVVVDRERSKSAALGFAEIAAAVRAKRGEIAQVPDLATLANVVVATHDGAPIRIHDIATLERVSRPRECIAVADDIDNAIVSTIYGASGFDLETVRAASVSALGALRPEQQGLAVRSFDERSTIELVVQVAGTSSEERLAELVDLKSVLSKVHGVEHVFGELGVSVGGVELDTPDEARLSVVVSPETDRARIAAAIRDRLAIDHVAAFDPADPRIQISGPDLEVLDRLASQVMPAVPDGARIAAGQTPRWTFRVDRDAVDRHRLQASEVDDIVAAAKAGLHVADISIGAAHMPIMLQIATASDALRFDVAAEDGVPVAMSEVAALEKRTEPLAIQHEDGRRWVGVRVRSKTKADRIRASLANMPPGYQWKLAQ